MKIPETKAILELYRKGIDDQDPAVCSALSVAEQDQDLQNFLRENEQLDQRIRNALRQGCPIPASLKESILHPCHEQKKEQSRIFPIWSRIAALFLLAALLTTLYINPNTPSTDIQIANIASMDDLELFANRYLNSQTNPQFNEVRSINEINQYLISQKLPEPHVLIKPIEAAERFGCGAIDYKGQKISLIRFREKRSQVACHLFIVSLKEFPQLPKNAPVQVKECSKGSAVRWSCSQRVYIMIFDAPKGQLDIVMGH